jgi:hypothetical protein
MLFAILISMPLASDLQRFFNASGSLIVEAVGARILGVSLKSPVFVGFWWYYLTTSTEPLKASGWAHKGVFYHLDSLLQ